MAEYRLQNLLGPKSEVIHLLFWYGVQQERRGDTGLSDAILNLWHLSASRSRSTHGSLRGVVLGGPYIHWGQGRCADAQGLVSKWAAGVSVAPHTEEVARIVVDTLLQIAANPHLRPFIPPDAWSWLNERPSLPPASRHLLSRCDREVFRTVRALDDTGILTSYLIAIWSGCEYFNYDGFVEMLTSVREDFEGIGVGYHREELIQQLDSALGKLSRQQRRFAFSVVFRTLPGDVMKAQYRELKRVLQEMDRKATEILNRMPPSFILPSVLTLTDLHRIPLDLHVCPASPMSVTSHLGRLTLSEITTALFVLVP